MNDALHTEPRRSERPSRRAKPPTSAPDLPSSDVTYTFKVLSASAGEQGAGVLRTVLFQRISGGEAIEISAETSAENLFAELPAFIEAALEVQRALGPGRGRDGAPSQEEALTRREQERVLHLFRGEESTPPATPEDEPKRRVALRLIGAAYRTIRTGDRRSSLPA
jgi:hypothetical protein